MQFKVPFSEIPEQGVEYELKDSSWFPENIIERAAPVVAHIRLSRKNEDRIELKGILQTSVLLECDRCLKKYTFPVNSPMQLVVEVADSSDHWRLQNIEPTGAELETISQDKRVVDLAELLRQQLFLALPEKRLCMKECSGLCPQCGGDLNEKKCGCSKGSGNSPFAVLKTLNKK